MFGRAIQSDREDDTGTAGEVENRDADEQAEECYISPRGRRVLQPDPFDMTCRTLVLLT